MYHTKETVVVPNWGIVVKSIASVILLVMCYSLVMSVSNSWNSAIEHDAIREE